MKREFYVCDGKDGGDACGAILVSDQDGRVIKGTVSDPNNKSLIDTGDSERALCMKHLRIEFGLETIK